MGSGAGAAPARLAREMMARGELHFEGWGLSLLVEELIGSAVLNAGG